LDAPCGDGLGEGAALAGAGCLVTPADLEESIVPLHDDLFGQEQKVVCSQVMILLRFVRRALEGIQAPKPFQAEYEGSIPFTRSNVFKHLLDLLFSIPTSWLNPFRQTFTFWPSAYAA
jgi:hypothetical protein